MNRAAPYDDIGFDELEAGLREGTVLLVDVREAHEFAAGHIPGSVLMPLSAFDPAEVPQAPGRTIVIACQAGVRSLSALRLAAQAGRADIRAHYPGGFAQWRAMGAPVERGGA